MSELIQSYINGEWVVPSDQFRPVINPATGEAFAKVAMGTAETVDIAVAAATRAFSGYAETEVAERIEFLERISSAYQKRIEDIATAITAEMGSCLEFSRRVQAANPLKHFEQMIAVLKDFQFEREIGTTAVLRREPVGVCGLITAWNWPVTLIATKLAPALAAGCTVVLKPSEYTPLSAAIVAEVIDEARLPPGVFNLVNGDGQTVGAALSAHSGVDMVSLTGSLRAGQAVIQASAATIKRVTLELGGKSANIILSDADLGAAVQAGIDRCFLNSGQSCQAPSRMLVHRSQLDEAVKIARAHASSKVVGCPTDETSQLGPLANAAQFEKVQELIAAGIEEGATLVCGGLGMPEGLRRGYYVKPTVFSDVLPTMTIAREEIFGPVLSIMSYEFEDEAVMIANSTSYGLAGYVQSASLKSAGAVARRLRAGRIYINGAPSDRAAPMGGYKQSGLGREQGVFGLEEYLEVKSMIGAQ